MAGITVYEFDALVRDESGASAAPSLHLIPSPVFDWLEAQALRLTEVGQAPWLRLIQRGGKRAVQVTSFVGVIRVPNGFQMEVLPKVGKTMRVDEQPKARRLLIEMLRCLHGFRHIETHSANLAAARMPLLEVFIGEFLRAVEHTVKRGLRSDYHTQQDNLFALRGKLQMAQHLRANLVRRDRFFTEFDEFSPNRPENRLLHAALRRVLDWTSQHAHQQLARELCFVFADVPASQNPTVDFQRVRQDRGMAHYDAALAWARLILQGVSPLTGSGAHHATSLLFPMERVFEAFVAKHLPRQLAQGFSLRTQVSGKSLVQHQGQDWFRLKPDLLVQEAKTAHLVLDTKWKLLNSQLRSGADKYGLSQGDFYQLYAYGQHYLGGQGDLVLIYPKTDTFAQPLAVFEFLPFTDPSKLRLWVLPFCLELKQLLLPQCAQSKQILQFLN